MPILTPQERLGSTLSDGKYRLDRVLGKGGMGVVFAGTHAWTGRPVAIKLLRHEFVEDAGVVKRFLAEAKAAAGLKHPAVIDVLDMGRDDDGEVYLVLELLEGHALADALDERGALPVDEALAYLLPVMDALSEAHAQQIIHRDLKPDNVFLSRTVEGKVSPKLLDFGIAKFLEANSVATRTGTIVGTPHYMSPEQASSKPGIGPPSDVWSIAVVLVECLTGDRVFDGESIMEVLVAIMTAPLPALASIDGLPASMVSVLEKALEREPSHRYQTMQDLADALRTAAAEAGLDVDSARAFQAVAATSAGPASGVRGSEVDPAAGTGSSDDRLASATGRPSIDPMAATHESDSHQPRPDLADPLESPDAKAVPAMETAERPRSRWPMALGALALLGASAGGVYLAMVSEEVEPIEVAEPPATSPATAEEAPPPEAEPEPIPVGLAPPEAAAEANPSPPAEPAPEPPVVMEASPTTRRRRPRRAPRRPAMATMAESSAMSGTTMTQAAEATTETSTAETTMTEMASPMSTVLDPYERW